MIVHMVGGRHKVEFAQGPQRAYSLRRLSRDLWGFQPNPKGLVHSPRVLQGAAAVYSRLGPRPIPQTPRPPEATQGTEGTEGAEGAERPSMALLPLHSLCTARSLRVLRHLLPEH